MSLTFDEASSLLKAERILRICWLPLAILVNARNTNARHPTIAAGIAILNDFDNNVYTANPPNMHNIDVLVPDANILIITNAAIIKNTHLSFFILDVIPKMINATDAAAALQP
jgi:hypothetical protein